MERAQESTNSPTECRTALSICKVRLDTIVVDSGLVAVCVCIGLCGADVCVGTCQCDLQGLDISSFR
eukprot:m.123304 g.123304  ORF g.123304 m.123304 type:complete len:67 (+) comp22007_c0_seq1:236-436(+)